MYKFNKKRVGICATRLRVMKHEQVMAARAEEPPQNNPALRKRCRYNNKTVAHRLVAVYAIGQPTDTDNFSSFYDTQWLNRGQFSGDAKGTSALARIILCARDRPL